MSFEYRVTWKRAGLNPKRKRYVIRKNAERFLALLTDREPWVRAKQDPDAFYCCSGYQCGCGGITIREEAEARIAEYPAIEWTRIDLRTVGRWHDDSPPDAAAVSSMQDASLGCGDSTTTDE